MAKKVPTDKNPAYEKYISTVQQGPCSCDFRPKLAIIENLALLTNVNFYFEMYFNNRTLKKSTKFSPDWKFIEKVSLYKICIYLKQNKYSGIQLSSHKNSEEWRYIKKTIRIYNKVKIIGIKTMAKIWWVAAPEIVSIFASLQFFVEQYVVSIWRLTNSSSSLLSMIQTGLKIKWKNNRRWVWEKKVQNNVMMIL